MTAPLRRTAPVRRQFAADGRLLTSREIRERAERAERRRETERAAYDAWGRGLVVPHRITSALDIRQLYGPEVDHACGVEEPAVDQWEEGVLYPTWEQLCALAELTDFPVEFFTQPVRPSDVIRVADTTLIFHIRDPKALVDREPVLAFTAEAIAATLEGYCVACLAPRPGSRAIHTCEQTALF